VSRYRFIEVEKVSHAVRTLCRVLQVSRATYYHWHHQPLSEWAQDDAGLTTKIAAIHARSRLTYGAPRVQAELQTMGHSHSRKRVARLMRLAGLAGRHPRRFRRTTISDPLTSIPDLVQRDFAATRPNQLRVGDITYIRTWEGWLYLAVLLDCYSRRVVGWSMADHLRTELPLEALRMALARRGPAPELSHHTDRGWQGEFPCWSFTERLRQAGLVPSMGTVGDAYDNAVIESFWGRLQTELLNRQKWRTRIERSSALFEYLEIFHNRTRTHSSLGMLTPVDYENLHRGSVSVA
jgi:putative transposase